MSAVLAPSFPPSIPSDWQVAADWCFKAKQATKITVDKAFEIVKASLLHPDCEHHLSEAEFNQLKAIVDARINWMMSQYELVNLQPGWSEEKLNQWRLSICVSHRYSAEEMQCIERLFENKFKPKTSPKASQADNQAPLPAPLPESLPSPPVSPIPPADLSSLVVATSEAIAPTISGALHKTGSGEEDELDWGWKFAQILGQTYDADFDLLPSPNGNQRVSVYLLAQHLAAVNGKLPRLLDLRKLVELDSAAYAAIASSACLPSTDQITLRRQPTGFAVEVRHGDWHNDQQVSITGRYPLPRTISSLPPYFRVIGAGNRAQVKIEQSGIATTPLLWLGDDLQSSAMSLDLDSRSPHLGVIGANAPDRDSVLGMLLYQIMYLLPPHQAQIAILDQHPIHFRVLEDLPWLWGSDRLPTSLVLLRQAWNAILQEISRRSQKLFEVNAADWEEYNQQTPSQQMYALFVVCPNLNHLKQAIGEKTFESQLRQMLCDGAIVGVHVLIGINPRDLDSRSALLEEVSLLPHQIVLQTPVSQLSTAVLGKERAAIAAKLGSDGDAYYQSSQGSRAFDLRLQLYCGDRSVLAGWRNFTNLANFGPILQGDRPAYDFSTSLDLFLEDSNEADAGFENILTQDSTNLSAPTLRIVPSTVSLEEFHRAKELSQEVIQERGEFSLCQLLVRLYGERDYPDDPSKAGRGGYIETNKRKLAKTLSECTGKRLEAKDDQSKYEELLLA
jgi:hypothetical protein